MATKTLVVALALLVACGAANAANLRAYESLTASSKQDAIWTAVTADSTSWPWPSKLELLKIFFENMNVTFDTSSDVMPAGREKLIHSEGYVAKFLFEPAGNQSYTGGFAGANYGIVRFSFAAEPTSSGIIPASAWKFLRDGLPSGNMVAMHSLDPQASFNVFENIFTNHIGAPTDGGFIGKLIAHKFSEASHCIRTIGVSNVAAANEDGSLPVYPSSPFQVFLVPNPDIAFPDSSSNLDDWPALFAGIAPGTTLFEVRALLYPDSEEAELIGYMVSNSEIVPSWYGDTKLFFQHERMEADIAANPQWAQHGLDIKKLCG